MLTGTGIAAFAIGLAFSWPDKPVVSYDSIRNPTTGVVTVETVSHKSSGKFIPFSMFMLGACLVATGVPCLTVGLTERHKWRKRKNELDVKAGILSNTHVGFAMNF